MFRRVKKKVIDKKEVTHELGQRVSVLLPLPFDNLYDYRIPPKIYLINGSFVRVPFGRRRLIGVVWGAGNYEIEEDRIRDVEIVLNIPCFPEVSRRFVDWVSGYTMQPRGLVLKMAMSVPKALDPEVLLKVYSINTNIVDFKLTTARSRVLKILTEQGSMTASNIVKNALVSNSVIKKLVAIGVLIETDITNNKEEKIPEPDFKKLVFSCEQEKAVSKLVLGVRLNQFLVTLLDGVPGSGKTEVYFEAIAEVLRRQSQVLVLLPEISLSAQWLDRFKRRFGVNPGVWHSSLSMTERRKIWRGVLSGKTKVIVGARSSLFLPYSNLGLIIIDEEHDSGFKQEEGVIYNARDMAVVRARLGDVSVILVSATPSLETLMNVKQKRYDVLNLPSRHGEAGLPRIESINMMESPPKSGKWLSPILAKNLCDTVRNGEQVLLYLNRRGYSPLTLCKRCGHRFQCLRCTSWLVEHRQHNRLQCHQCGFAIIYPEKCPTCEAENSLVACGPGVERLEEEVNELMPNIQMVVAASDNILSKEGASQLVKKIENHEIDVIIGTQIIAKGYHFPLLTLVGVVDADLGLQGGDLRATERTFQILYQVAGRAGRAQRPGRVILQTYMSAHPVMAALLSGDKVKFMREESFARENASMPPFGRLVALIISGVGESEVDAVANSLGRMAPVVADVTIYGPAPAPFALLRGRHRRRLLVKSKRNTHIQRVIKDWLSKVNIPKSVKVYIDVDPMSFL